MKLGEAFHVKDKLKDLSDVENDIQTIADALRQPQQWKLVTHIDNKHGWTNRPLQTSEKCMEMLLNALKEEKARILAEIERM